MAAEILVDPVWWALQAWRRDRRMVMAAHSGCDSREAARRAVMATQTLGHWLKRAL